MARQDQTGLFSTLVIESDSGDPFIIYYETECIDRDTRDTMYGRHIGVTVEECEEICKKGFRL